MLLETKCSLRSVSVASIVNTRHIPYRTDRRPRLKAMGIACTLLAHLWCSVLPQSLRYATVLCTRYKPTTYHVLGRAYS